MEILNFFVLTLQLFIVNIEPFFTNQQKKMLIYNFFSEFSKKIENIWFFIINQHQPLHQPQNNFSIIDTISYVLIFASRINTQTLSNNMIISFRVVWPLSQLMSLTVVLIIKLLKFFYCYRNIITFFLNLFFFFLF